MTLWAEIELRRFDPESMRGRKNQHRRLEAVELLLAEPISAELDIFLRKVRLAALFETGFSNGGVIEKPFEEIRDLSDWEIEKMRARQQLEREVS